MFDKGQHVTDMLPFFWVPVSQLTLQMGYRPHGRQSCFHRSGRDVPLAPTLSSFHALTVRFTGIAFRDGIGDRPTP